MIRKTYSTLVAMALAALVMVGCGKEDVSDLTSTWTEKEGEVQTKLTEVQAKSQELQTRLQGVTVANPTDTTMATARTSVETMLQNNMTKISEIEAQLKANTAKRDSMTQLGNRAEYETAWKAAEIEYNAAMEALNTIESQNNDMVSLLDNMNKPAANADTDTAAANSNGTNVKSDTAVLVDTKKVDDASAKKAADDTKKTDEKPAESSK